MSIPMASGTFRLKGRNLLSLGKGTDSAHKLHLDSRISWPTIHQYVQRPEAVQSLNLKVLYGILVDGLGMENGEWKSIRLGELLDACPDEDKAVK